MREARARQIAVSEEGLKVDLVDGRTLITPLIWFPRLWHGTQAERDNFEILAAGAFLHWPDLDEDLSVAGLLAGFPSCEALDSLGRWIDARAARGKFRGRSL